MIVTVQYTQLNSTSCIRETFHDGNQVSVETLDQRTIPIEVQRLMLMPRLNPLEQPLMTTLVNYGPEEVMRIAGELNETMEEVYKND